LRGVLCDNQHVDISNLIQTVLIYALPVIFAITIHEAAHAYAALYFGDKTAYSLGRVTLNPIKHIDPIGTIAMPLLLYFATNGSFLFGYAKPVPVHFSALRNPRRDTIWVVFAGPGSNFVQALIWGILLYGMAIFGMNERFFIEMCRAGMLVNVVMFVFNLFPVPPLDGGRIAVALLPYRYSSMLARVEPYGFFIVMGLVIAGIASVIWMRPLMTLTYGLLEILLTPLRLIAS
jgi:Zn-dependent protease